MDVISFLDNRLRVLVVDFSIWMRRNVENGRRKEESRDEEEQSFPGVSLVHSSPSSRRRASSKKGTPTEVNAFLLWRGAPSKTAPNGSLSLGCFHSLPFRRKSWKGLSPLSLIHRKTLLDFSRLLSLPSSLLSFIYLLLSSLFRLLTGSFPLLTFYCLLLSTSLTSSSSKILTPSFSIGFFSNHIIKFQKKKWIFIRFFSKKCNLGKVWSFSQIFLF